MAAGDVARDAVRSAGDLHRLTGQIEVDVTPRVFDLVGTSHTIVSCMLTDTDGTATAQCKLNVNASDVATAGSIKAICNAPSVETFQFDCLYI